MSITVKGQATVNRGTHVTKYSIKSSSGVTTFSDKVQASQVTSPTKTIIAPAAAIGQNANGSYVFAPAPANAVGQNADGSYILGNSGASIGSSSNSTNGLPPFTPFDIIRGAITGAQTVEQRATDAIINTAQDAKNSYNQNVKQEVDALIDRVSRGGGLITTPGDLIKDTGKLVGETAAEIINPISVPLILAVGIFAYGATR